MLNANKVVKEYVDFCSAAPCLLVWKDIKGKYLACSDSFLKKMGFSERSEILGKSDDQLPWHNSSDSISKSDNQALTKKLTLKCEEKLISKAGKAFLLLATKNPIINENQKIVGLSILYEENIPNKSSTAGKFLESYFEGIINCIPANIYWKDKESVIIGCNDRLALSAGFKNTQELIGKTDFDLPWADQAEQIRNNDIEIMNSGLSRTFEEVSKRLDGSISYFLTTKSPLIDENGEVFGIVGISLDITERKSAEQAFNEAQKNFELQKTYLDNIIAYLPANVFWKNAQSIILGCNDRLVQCAGLSKAEEIIGKSDYELPWREQADAVIQNDKEVMASGLTRSYEEAGKLPDGSMATFLTIKAPLRDKQNNIIGVLGISVDITERKMMEAALVEAKQKAEEAIHVKSEFIENMQHDLRTPALGVWTAVVDLFKEEIDKEKKTKLKMIEKSAKRLFKLCVEVTDFDKVERNEQVVINKKFDLNQLVHNVIDLYETAAYKKGLALSCQSSP